MRGWVVVVVGAGGGAVVQDSSGGGTGRCGLLVVACWVVEVGVGSGDRAVRGVGAGERVLRAQLPTRAPCN